MGMIAMAKTGDEKPWTPTLRKSAGPVYLAIAGALSDDIRAGTLPAGARLPTQRELADALGIHFTTVTRAYEEARRLGLVEGRVGQGTYVRRNPSISAPPVSTGLVDMSMNVPPRFDDAGLVARMWSGIASLESTGGVDLLFRYQESGGAQDDKAAGALWLSDRLPSLRAEQILVCPGAQGALLAVVGLLAGAGDAICAESLTYPGIRALAAHLKIRLIAAEIDEEGLVPDALDAVCRREKPKAVFCTPTLHSPTAATMSLERRKAIVAVARQHGVPIIEDDAYGRLLRRAPPPLAALGPELVYYVAGLAKCLSPALRVAYLVPPDARTAARLSGAMRAMSSITSPLTAAIATNWINNGTAEAVLAAIQKEASARQEIAKAVLPPGTFIAHPEGYHLWLLLPSPWTRAEFTTRLRSVGIGVVSSDAFAVGLAPEAVRLSLGVPATKSDLRASLQTIANLIAEQPALSSMVV
jgi:DNA-binding transcriptional MocR family regulator